MATRRKKKYNNHEDYVKYQEEKRKQEENMQPKDRELLESFRETAALNNTRYNKQYTEKRVNTIPPSILDESTHKKSVEINSRKAAYHEKSHCYDLNAYATLVASGIDKEDAKEILKFFYTDIIDDLHENEPQFKKNNVSTTTANTQRNVSTTIQRNNTYVPSTAVRYVPKKPYSRPQY